MIYLIQVRYEDFTLAKIGYAKDIKRRMNSYITENPMATLVSYREGSMEEEKLFHRAFSIDKFEKGLEWFYWKDDTKERFDSLDYSTERKKKLIEDLNKEKNYNKKLELYKEIKEKYDKSYIDETLDKISILLESISSSSENLIEIIINPEDELIISTFLNNYFYKTNVFKEKMKMYCEFREMFNNNPVVIDALEHRIKDSRFHQYYKFYGTKGCSSRSYEEKELKQGWEDSTKENQILIRIYSRFKENDRVLMPDVKLFFKELYNSLSISKSPKATDLADYFELSKTNITTPDGIKKGFKLGKRLK